MQSENPQSVDYDALASQIRAWAHELGFQSVGITDIRLTEAEWRLHEWLSLGLHGGLDYMANRVNKRSRPAALVPGTLRVVSVRMNYLPPGARDSWEVLADPDCAFISRYALGRDYHKVLRGRLAHLLDRIRGSIAGAGGRVFADSAPVMEVELARKAGVGWRGKNTLLITREHGSYFFLGEIYLNLPLPIDSPAREHCGTCTRCIEICPTGAIIAPYRLDARRCISYLTIEHRGSIPVELRPLIGNRIYGCDDCQLVCPWNGRAKVTEEPDFHIRHGLDDITLRDVFLWDEAEFKARLSGTAIYRIGYEQWLRNVAVALGNSKRSDGAMAALKVRARHESDMVREHAEWALGQQANK